MTVKYLTREDLPAYGLQLSDSAINRRIKRGDFPRPRYDLLPCRCWLESEIVAYVESPDRHKTRRGAKLEQVRDSE